MIVVARTDLATTISKLIEIQRGPVSRPIASPHFASTSGASSTGFALAFCAISAIDVMS